MNPQKENSKGRWQAEEARVQVGLWERNPIDFPVPLDEYDRLVHHVLSLLERGESPDQIRQLLATNLTEHFGLDRSWRGLERAIECICGLGRRATGEHG